MDIVSHVVSSHSIDCSKPRLLVALRVQVRYGRVDMVYAANFFHLRDREDQQRILELLVKLAQLHQWSISFGSQLGSAIPKQIVEAKAKTARSLADIIL